MAAKMHDIIEQIKKMTLLEVADLVKGLEEAFGVSAAMPAASASGPGAALRKRHQQKKRSLNIK